jgi:hypothetical protein
VDVGLKAADTEFLHLAMTAIDIKTPAFLRALAEMTVF